jgi:hypothetical protein
MTKSLAEVLSDKEPVVAPVVPVVEPVLTQTVTDVVPFAENERAPADWTLVPVDGGEDLYQATHRVTRKVFVGTIGNFNVALRG